MCLNEATTTAPYFTWTPNTVLETTVSQVNFVFAVDCGLIDYARRRQHDIEADHIDTVAV